MGNIGDGQAMQKFVNPQQNFDADPGRRPLISPSPWRC